MSEERITRIPELTVVGDGRYRIGRRLGRGGMGQVYEATNTVTGKAVALKWLVHDRADDEEAGRRLLREARIAARVQHPNVADIYDVGDEGDAVFLVMELLEGVPLDAWIAEHAPADPDELVTIFIPVVRGLTALHAAGIVHRDLKPANVFIVRTEHDPRPVPKLIDFGIARDSLTRSTTITKPGQVLGTPAYMAPEQLDGPDEVDPRSDVYACGVILYEALAGERPFVAGSLKALVAKIVRGAPRPLHVRRPDVPRALCDLVMKAMSTEPSSRFDDPQALGAALEAYADAGSPPARPVPVALLVGGFVAGAIVVGALASMSGSNDRPVAPTPAAQAIAERTGEQAEAVDAASGSMGTEVALGDGPLAPPEGTPPGGDERESDTGEPAPRQPPARRGARRGSAAPAAAPAPPPTATEPAPALETAASEEEGPNDAPGLVLDRGDF